MNIDTISEIVVDSAYHIHQGLGPGLLESVYEIVLAGKLKGQGLSVQRQFPVTFEYEGMTFAEAFRVDLLVEEKLIIELKSVELIAPVYSKQLLTYLRLMNLEVGLLINFGDVLIKNGIKRVVNKYTPSVSSKLDINKKEEKLT